MNTTHPMEQRHSPLAFLRSLSPKTKHAIAFFGALLPALFVGYAQFYMRTKADSASVATKTVSQSISQGEHVSAFAAFTKIFSEGKAAVGEATSALKEFNKAYLSDEVVTSNDAENILTDTEVERLTNE